MTEENANSQIIPFQGEREEQPASSSEKMDE